MSTLVMVMQSKVTKVVACLPRAGLSRLAAMMGKMGTQGHEQRAIYRLGLLLVSIRRMLTSRARLAHAESRRVASDQPLSNFIDIGGAAPDGALGDEVNEAL
jgi:hypothetical protein